MRGRWGRLAPLVAVLAGVALGAALIAPAGGADTVGARLERLEHRSATLARSEHRALLDLYAAEAVFGRARSEVQRTEAVAAALAREEESARRRAAIVRRSLAASQRRVAETLRLLYMEGETDPIAVVLGASSLDEVLAGIDGLRRSAAQSQSYGREAAAQARRLTVLQARLAQRRTVLEAARAAATEAARRLGVAAGMRRATLTKLRREGALTKRRLAVLQALARVAERASALITPPATAPAVLAAETIVVSAGTANTFAPASPAPFGDMDELQDSPRTLPVDAVAYHLPGRTASGLPVGPGIVAVDPNVIPLGTRLFIPGYGPGIAADVGSAVRGSIIDLWMPSTAAALRWGRRAVTITIYG